MADPAPRDVASSVRNVHRALKADGSFAVQYIDGVVYFERERFPEEGVEQEGPVRITRRFKEYWPEDAAWVVTYTNEVTGESYDYTTYTYPAGLLRALMEPHFALARSTRLSEGGFLDVFARRSLSPSG